jgi:hypothetical protein
MRVIMSIPEKQSTSGTAIPSVIRSTHNKDLRRQYCHIFAEPASFVLQSLNRIDSFRHVV